MGLPSRALVCHESRRLRGDLRSEALRNDVQRQSEVHAGAQAPGSGEASLAQEQFLRLDAQCRLPASQIRRKAPVCRDAAPVEQPGRREYVGARAHCNHASTRGRAFSQSRHAAVDRS